MIQALGLRLGILVLLITASRGLAAPSFDTSNPRSFFTNVANCLLSAEFNLSLTQIQVYPNNQYTPAVHRLLQVTANIYDATSTNFYPSVFRPLFSTDSTGTNVFITGYQQVAAVSGINDIQLSQPFDPSALSTPGVLMTNVPVNVYGVPWIIGAKTGFPAFNQLSMVNSASYIRRLEVVRPTATALPNQTNQMVTMTINNCLGFSFWNSYSNDYVGSGDLTVFAGCANNIFLTNSILGPNNPFKFSFVTNCIVNLSYWPGSHWGANDSGLPSPNSFISANWTNTLVPGYAINFANGGFASTNGGFPGSPWDSTLAPLPPMGLITTNWFQAYILDGNHVIDYVQLRGPIDSTNLTAALVDPSFTGQTYYLWATNTGPTGPSFGIRDQLAISTAEGITLPASAMWTPTTGIPYAAQQIYFAAAFTPAHFYTYNNVLYYNYALTNQAPYTAVRTIFVPYLYQVNDPLVHYLVGDLDAGPAGIWANNYTLQNGVWLQNNGAVAQTVPTVPSSLNPGISAGGFAPNEKANSRYQPWGQPASPILQTSSSYDFLSPYNLTYKDPGVWGPDCWNFPTNQTWNLNWLGQVHRGTPWQTIYLKASDILQDATLNAYGNSVGPATWAVWGGDTIDSASSAPVTDRQLVNLLAALLNTNDLRTQFSVNNPNPNAWTALFDGFAVLTNSSSGLVPSLVSSNSPPALALADAILAFHPYQPFLAIGDILAVPTLTEQSPYLAGAAVTSVTDEAYEAIPSQLLPLLRTDSIGAMVSSNELMQVQFSGYDGHAYAVQVSSDLIKWNNLTTNSPVNGSFNFPLPTASNSPQQFYRTMLLQ
jgi:hypothetical protein